MKIFLIFFLTTLILFFIPEYYITYFVADIDTPYRWYLHTESIVWLIALFAIVIITKSLALKITLASVIVLLQLTQLMHFTYYGAFYSQYSINYMLTEVGDFITGIGALFELVKRIFFICVLASGFLIMTLIWQHKKHPIPSTNTPGYLAIILLTMPFFKALSDERAYKPSDKQLSVRAGLYSLNNYFAMKFQKRTITEYLPYQLIHTTPKLDNLILIMGESANYRRMSLFGAERDTTPFLTSLVQSPNFHHQLMMTSSVATPFAMAYFLNGIHEPDNIVQMAAKTTNLFKIAEEQGFDLHFLSNHTLGSQPSMYRIGNFKTWIDKSMPLSQWGQYDKGMIDTYLKHKNTKRTSQFIVLHTYNMHPPYPENHPARFNQFAEDGNDVRAKLRGEYDNALSYFDHTIQYWVQQLKTHLAGRTLLVYVPDHGENFHGKGRNPNHSHEESHIHNHEHQHSGGGWHGHGFLDFDVATTPLFAININEAEVALSHFASELNCLSSHFRVHNALAGLLGAKVINPNEDNSKFYVSGLSYDGAAGWLEGQFEDFTHLCHVPQHASKRPHQASR